MIKLRKENSTCLPSFNVGMCQLAMSELNIFSSQFRVYYEDTDVGGRVYHANYLKFCERTRTDFVREALGYQQGKHLQEDKKGFVVSSLKARFLAGAKLEDELIVTCVPVSLRRASLEMYQEVIDKHTNKVLFAMQSTIAYINFVSESPEVIPSDFADVLKANMPKEDFKTIKLG